MVPQKKILQYRNIDLLATGATTTLFTPFNGRTFIVEKVVTRLKARTGTITEARIAVKADTTDIVASALPVQSGSASAVDSVKDMTVAAGAPAATYSAPLKLVTIQEATATVAKIDLIIEGLLV